MVRGCIKPLSSELFNGGWSIFNETISKERKGIMTETSKPDVYVMPFGAGFTPYGPFLIGVESSSLYYFTPTNSVELIRKSLAPRLKFKFNDYFKCSIRARFSDLFSENILSGRKNQMTFQCSGSSSSFNRWVTLGGWLNFKPTPNKHGYNTSSSHIPISPEKPATNFFPVVISEDQPKPPSIFIQNRNHIIFTGLGDYIPYSAFIIDTNDILDFTMSVEFGLELAALGLDFSISWPVYDTNPENNSSFGKEFFFWFGHNY